MVRNGGNFFVFASSNKSRRLSEEHITVISKTVIQIVIYSDESAGFLSSPQTAAAH